MLTVGAGWRSLANVMLRPLYPRESRNTHVTESWVGLKAYLDGCGVQHVLSQPGFEPRTVQSVASRHTNYVSVSWPPRNILQCPSCWKPSWPRRLSRRFAEVKFLEGDEKSYCAKTVADHLQATQRVCVFCRPPPAVHTVYLCVLQVTTCCTHTVFVFCRSPPAVHTVCLCSAGHHLLSTQCVCVTISSLTPSNYFPKRD